MSTKRLLTIGVSGAAAFFADGYIGINDEIDKLMGPPDPAKPNFKANIAMGAELGLGTALALMKGRGTMGMVKDVAAGASLGLGARRLAKKMGMVSGYQSTPVLGKRHVGGYQNTPVLGSTDVPSALSGAGIPSAVSGSGYRVNGPGYSPNGSNVGVMNGVGSARDRRNGSGYMR